VGLSKKTHQPKVGRVARLVTGGFHIPRPLTAAPAHQLTDSKNQLQKVAKLQNVYLTLMQVVYKKIPTNLKHHYFHGLSLWCPK
jgi:hypothetical protein